MAPAGCPVSDGGPTSAPGALHRDVRLAFMGAFIRNQGRPALSGHGWRATAPRLRGSKNFATPRTSQRQELRSAKTSRLSDCAALPERLTEALEARRQRCRPCAGMLGQGVDAAFDADRFLEMVLFPGNVFEDRRGWVPVGQVDMDLAHLAGMRHGREPVRMGDLDVLRDPGRPGRSKRTTQAPSSPALFRPHWHERRSARRFASPL